MECPWAHEPPNSCGILGPFVLGARVLCRAKPSARSSWAVVETFLQRSDQHALQCRSIGQIVTRR